MVKFEGNAVFRDRGMNESYIWILDPILVLYGQCFDFSKKNNFSARLLYVLLLL